MAARWPRPAGGQQSAGGSQLATAGRQAMRNISIQLSRRYSDVI
jgi:hypothetical protein